MMMLFWNSAAAAIVVAALLIAIVPTRWLLGTMIAWLVSPVPIYFGFVIWEASKADGAEVMANAMMGFSLISAFMLIPWLVVSLLGFFVRYLLRAVFRKPR